MEGSGSIHTVLLGQRISKLLSAPRKISNFVVLAFEQTGHNIRRASRVQCDSQLFLATQSTFIEADPTVFGVFNVTFNEAMNVFRSVFVSPVMTPLSHPAEHVTGTL